MSNKFKLMFVRHGETSLNKSRVLQGHTDEPLNETGRSQSIYLGKHLHHEKFTHVFSSDLKRAQHTCELVMSQNILSLKKDKIQIDVRLREKNYGSMEGKPVSDLFKAAKVANMDVSKYTPEGGETTQEIKGRSEAFFKDLCKTIYDDIKCTGKSESSYCANVLVVAHGGLLRQTFQILNEKYGCEFDNHRIQQCISNASFSCFIVSLPILDDSTSEHCEMSEEENYVYMDSMSLWFSGITVKCTSFNNIP